MLIRSIESSLDGLSSLLPQLTPQVFVRPCAALSGASLGEHTRHIIEMFRCLEGSYESGLVNYDNRERNFLIQSDPGFALQCILDIRRGLSKPNKDLELLQVIDGQELYIRSNYERELLYNLEHCIHHQALMKVALLECEGIALDSGFGIARSTIEYRNQCAQ